MAVWEGGRKNKLLCAEGLPCARIDALTPCLTPEFPTSPLVQVLPHFTDVETKAGGRDSCLGSSGGRD